MENLNKILFILLFLCSCTLTQYTYDLIYEDHPHTTEVYYNGIDIYFGYNYGFYYYYGIPHLYPWWYYYQFIPPYHYHTYSHIHVHCDNGHYVYGHRGPLFHNTGPDCNINAGHFKPTVKPKNNKDKSFVFPRDWKSSNSTRINKQNDNVNKINIKSNNIINSNKNRSNNKIKINNNSNNRSNKNKSNRSNKKRP